MTLNRAGKYLSGCFGSSNFFFLLNVYLMHENRLETNSPGLVREAVAWVLGFNVLSRDAITCGLNLLVLCCAPRDESSTQVFPCYN